ncbi:MAG: GatB/YqeY domain-containing protein, partial [Bacteroidota bacterium]
MGLKEQISDEIKAAMKMPDKTRLETLRTLRAALMEKEIEKRGTGQPMTPEDDVAVMMSAAKKRKESIEQFDKGGRPELADQERKELAIIQEYLPKQISAEDISKVIEQVVAETGASVAAD